MGKKNSTSHKKQHFVAQAYMRPWCDPKTPSGEKPYVWLIAKDGAAPRRKAPQNLFHESNMYTITLPSGERDLRIENGLQGLEDKFTRIRNRSLQRRRWPTSEEMAWLLAFVSAAKARTQVLRDHWRSQWGGIRQKMERLEKAYEEAPPEGKRAFEAMSALGPRTQGAGRGMDIEDVKRLEAEPIQRALAPFVKTVLQAMSNMHVAVLCTDDPIGFVTTDDPCAWFDPELWKMPAYLLSPGLGSSTIEVTMPLSPEQCLLISRQVNIEGFMDVKPETVDALNARHISHASKFFISRTDVVRANWFKISSAQEV